MSFFLPYCSMTLFSRYSPLLKHITPPRNILILLAVLMLAENGIALLTPWIAGQLTKSILSETTFLSLSYKQMILILFFVISIQCLLSYISRLISGSTAERMLVQLRTHLYNHLQGLPLCFHHNRKHGETLALITNDSAVISSFVTGTLIGIVPHILTAFGAVICIGIYNPLIAALVVILIPLFYILIKLLGRRVRPITRQLMDQYAATFSIAEENLSSLSTIKIFTREGLESSRFNGSNERLYELSYKYLNHQARLAPIVKLVATGIVLLILLLIGDDISSGYLSTGDIVSVMLYGMLLTQPISRLADTYGQIQRTASSADRLLEVFDYETEQVDKGIELPAISGRIEISNISFSYPGRKDILENLSLTIQPGETLAITGENGAGKSTLATLIMRFSHPSNGNIRIDGFDIEDVSLTSLRKQIGLVEQHVLLQNTTVIENIRFGKPDATDEDIVQAAQAAHALEFISNLPAGFDTIIGDHGIKLSGGQKQRLSLARALISDPAILILDEATAMFDPQGEIQFIENNRKLLNSRTVILITHRPASLSLADRILRLENGSFVIDSMSGIA